jgi:hypothetical protein
MKWMEERHQAADHILCVVSAGYLDKPFSSLERRAARLSVANRVGALHASTKTGIAKFARSSAAAHCAHGTGVLLRLLAIGRITVADLEEADDPALAKNGSGPAGPLVMPTADAPEVENAFLAALCARWSRSRSPSHRAIPWKCRANGERFRAMCWRGWRPISDRAMGRAVRPSVCGGTAAEPEIPALRITARPAAASPLARGLDLEAVQPPLGVHGATPASARA